ncbi:hypothetical protein DYB38_006145 [Aphanomyces astaci]|uniref:FYVE-type domain-containing protein n=1 Tax=Aphanomyces astaci TaxID=112090 RepID=A0A397D0D3_APHAT|nr:hypothetical protein DYB38_006145 [Aphanomyces astaci]
MRVDILADEYAAHARHMEWIVKNALAESGKWTPQSVKNGWAVDVDRHGWRVCSKSLPTSSSVRSPSKRMVVCHGSHQASLSTLRDELYADNTRDYLAMAAVLHGASLYDAAVLDVHSTRTPDDPGHFFGVKWLQLTVAANKPPVSFLFLEFTGTCIDPQGRVTLFVVTEPILASHGASTSRTTTSPTEGVSCVKLYRARPDGHVDVFVRAHYTPGSSTSASRRQLPRTTTWRGMDMNIPLSLGKDIGPLLQESSLHESLVLTTGEFSPQWDYSTLDWILFNRTRCNVCEKKGMFWHRHHHCRCCGLVMCSGCFVKLHCVRRPSTPKWKKPSSHKSLKAVVEVKFCIKCWVHARTEARKQPASVASVHPALDTTLAALETIVRVGAPNNATTAEWWKSTREGDCMSSIDTSCMSTSASVDTAYDLPLSTMSASYRSHTCRINSFNLLSTPSSRESMAARMDEMNESIALQTMMLSTMTRILTPQTPPAVVDVVVKYE